MYTSPVRSATASTGTTALALVAIFSLLLSLFAIARPAIAFDDVAGPAVTPTVGAGNPSCPAGTTEIKFEGANLVEGKRLFVIIDEQEVGVTITNVNVAAGTFDFEVDGGLALVVIAKGGPNGNIYDYRPLGGAAHDDGLRTPTNPKNGKPYGISHISFCVIPVIASIDIEKTGPELSKATDPAAYTVTITNDGNVLLYIESIIDSLQGDLTDAANYDTSDCGASLAVDATCTITYSYTVATDDPDPLLNDVTVDADTASDFSGIEATDTDSFSVELFQPDIEVTKTGDVTEALVGDTVTYTVTIENTSSSDSPDLELTKIEDSLQGDLTDAANYDSSDCGATLAADVTCTIVYSRVVLDTDPDPLVNTVSVESNPAGFPNDIDDEDSFSVDILVPSIDIEKTGPDLSKATDPAAYTVSITNDGDVLLYIESIIDSLQGDLTDAANYDTSDCGASLAVDDTCTITYSYTVATDDPDPLLNEVTVNADTASDFSGTVATDTDSFSVELFQPGITVDKTGPAAAEVGDVITYTVTITNTSSSDSPNLVIDAVTDTLVGDLTDEAIAECGELEPAAVCVLTYDYTVTADSPDPIDNTVTVETHPDGFPNDIDDSDSHQVDVVEELGSITINKEIGCEICETFTPGFFFNRGENNAGTAFTNEWLPDNQVTIAGETFGDGDLGWTEEVEELSAVQEINAYLNADRSGELDGEMGLSAQGQLVRQFLALYLNVGFAGDECELADAVYTGDVVLPDWVDANDDGQITVQEILDAADDATTEEDMRLIAEAIDQINNSGDGDNPVVLECPEGTEGTTGAGFNFTLYGPNDSTLEADSGTTNADGTLVLDGEPDGSGLPLGDYLLVEGDNEAGLDCEIVDVTVTGGGTDDQVVPNDDGTFTITLTEENADLVITVVNDCKEDGGGDEFGDIEIRKSAADDPAESFFFSASWDEEGFTLMDGDAEFSGDLLAGEEYTVTEELTEEQIAAGWSLEDISCDGGADVVVSEDGMSVTITLGADESVICTFTNALEEEDEEGTIEVIKFFCQTEGEDQIFVLGPVEDEPIEGDSVSTLSEHEDGDELPSDEGCTLGADAEGMGATFTVTGADEDNADFEWTFTTVSNPIVTEMLDVGSYTITEHGTGLTANFEIALDGDTAVVVFNYEELEEDQGRIKIIKFFCDGLEDDVVFSIVEGQNVPTSSVDTPEQATNCEVGDAAFTLNDGETDSATFTVGPDGIRLIPVDVGDYSLTEVLPNQATSNEFGVVEGETTTVIVFNLEGDEGEEEETVEVSIMKHLCTDVATLAEFEAIEAEAAEENPDNAAAPLVATVLACPTIVFTGDIPTEGAVSGGDVDFEFSVLDASGTQMLSLDGAFMAAALCESDVMLDLDGNPDVDACLDISDYTFEVVDGLVVITETDAPEGHRLGTIRFTPGSDDDAAYTDSGVIETAETTGVIVIDTSLDEDDAVMIHAYNFVLEGTQGSNPPGGGGTSPDNETPREGTQGGNPLPNTAISPNLTGSVPAALLALLMLTGLSAAGYAMATEARRRR